ncbi:caspase domain-containing protein [Vararia minispora EC-137]|uniref:Caspase domain-containing protein n=1 Tax=Vararia minispora EC-137 TaxID=1314806 RepID=A0ACB8QA40_9AGAM|nr:caspase domain-containing protein [Vararia minispora EC-137]
MGGIFRGSSARSIPERPDPSTNNSVTNVHALLVGINRYASSQFPNLLGAVSDMQRIKDFLTSDLSVPEECIMELTDENATRERIILAIQDLASPQNGINNGDPILIYFAGHGSTVRAPQDWTSDPTIQVLVPHDGHSDGTVASSLITDRKFGNLLRDLADAKGDNITVILDCCHSTSGTRNATAPKEEEDKDFLPRGVELKQADNPDLDVILAPEYREEVQCQSVEDEEEKRGIATSGRFLNASMRSHILLAACGENQSALEKKGSGVFTTALLTHFKARGINSHTYAQIIVALGKLAHGRQTPQCEGAHRHERKLFDSRAHFRGYAPRSVHFSEADSTYTLTNAGQVHGVTPDTEFAVYASLEDMVQAGPLCYLLVDQVSTTTSTLRPRPSEALPDSLLPSTAVAFQFQATHPIGNLRIYIPDEEQLQFVYQAVERGRRGGGALWSIERSDEEHATLGVVLEGANVAFNILDEEICSLGLTRLRFTVPATVDHVAAALRSAAHYFFHLNRMPETPLVRDKIRMHVYKLEETDDLDDDLRRILRPLQPQMDLIAAHKDPAKVRKGMYAPWTVVADDVETYYGIELQNETKVGLFLSMFYFDCGTLEIRQLYSFSTAAPEARNLDRPLRPKASLSLNYGSGGGEPLRFVVDDEHSLDFGIVRIFISNQPFDLDIEQKPFEASQLDSDTRSVSNSTKPRAVQKSSIWDVITLPIIQTKPRSP